MGMAGGGGAIRHFVGVPTHPRVRMRGRVRCARRVAYLLPLFPGVRCGSFRYPPIHGEKRKRFLHPAIYFGIVFLHLHLLASSCGTW